ncbi:hypothetical protein Lalb_Chr24g0400201 [Lupinus albus]|uniref:Uncharacterized protein n=1 Tax=Lupinus albus TaxID=3870 RepID=A0A6A4MRT1_LUPAL|nr:hypothetical protein Lalb_Chr24g0400201 [Lupinus albus]
MSELNLPGLIKGEGWLSLKRGWIDQCAMRIGLMLGVGSLATLCLDYLLIITLCCCTLFLQLLPGSLNFDSIRCA